MDRILKNAPSTIDVTAYDGETPTDFSTAVAVTVLKADGSTLTSGTATQGTVGDGKYTFALSGANTAALNELEVRWTGTLGGSAMTVKTYVEVVGGFYFSLAQLRAMPNLDSSTKFTTAELVDVREWFEEKFEDFTGVAWVPRYRRVRMDGSGISSLLLPDFPVRSVRSVWVYEDADTYTAYTAAELTDLVVDSVGNVNRIALGSFTRGTRNVVVEYEHGFDSPPADVVDAALVACRDKLLGAYVGNRQFSVQTEVGVVRTSTPDPSQGRPFGIPDVDAVCVSRSHKVPAVA